MRLWNRDYTKNELMKHIGDMSQVCGVRRTVLDDGPGRGMRAFDVRTGGGLAFTVLPDRGLDIGWCHYNGTPVAFISKTGAVAPGLCEYPGSGFLRGFTGGLLTTCGYTHMGAACVDNGAPLGLHGRGTMLASDRTTADEYWEGDEYVIRISGLMREAAMFGENIHLRRIITTKAGENRIWIHDSVENSGFEPQPLIMLYHFNFGHPLVGSETKLVTSGSSTVTPRDEAALSGLDRCYFFEPPSHRYEEQVFYHDLVPTGDGSVFAGLYNPAVDTSVTIHHKKSELQYLVEWKQMGEGDYVCGIEPATWKPEGRSKARESGELLMIEPGARRDFHLELCFSSCLRLC
jgi:hypothetical protein